MNPTKFEHLIQSISPKLTKCLLDFDDLLPAQLIFILDKLHAFNPNNLILTIIGSVKASENFSLFVNFLSLNANVKELILADTNIQDAELKLLCVALSTNTYLYYLDISNNDFGIEGFQALNLLLDVNYLLCLIKLGRIDTSNISLLNQFYEIQNKINFNQKLKNLTISSRASLDNVVISFDKLLPWIQQNNLENHLIQPFPKKLKPQLGSTCGYHGLSLATQFFHAKNQMWKAYHVHKKMKGDPKALLPIGKQAGFFKTGSIANIAQLKQIMEQTEYESQIITFNRSNFNQLIRDNLQKSIPVLLAINMPRQAKIKKSKGAGAHLITIVGFFHIQGQDHFIFISSNDILCAKASTLYASATQLTQAPEAYYEKKGRVYLKVNKNFIETATPEQCARFYKRPMVSLESFTTNLFILYPKLEPQQLGYPS